MITRVIVAPHQTRGGVLKSAAWNGQFCTISGYDANGEAYLVPVAASGTASLPADYLFPIQYLPRTNEEEELYQNPGSSTVATAMPSGTRVMYFIGNVCLQDDQVISRYSSNTFSGATVGAKIYLNSSGWPVIATGSNVGTTVIATLDRYESGIVQYTKISYGG